MSRQGNKERVQELVTTKYGSFWQDAVPLPYYGTNWLFQDTFRCHCKAKFKKESDYENHYRKEHIKER